MAARLGVGVVGIGWCAAQHISAFRKNPHTEIVAMVGRDVDRVHATLAKNGQSAAGARVTTRFEDLLEADDVHIIDIATPNDLHAAQAVAAAKAAIRRSTPIRSASSKRAGLGESMSKTPRSTPAVTMGTTSSDRERLSQAMWPGKAWTSGTRIASRREAAAPQTPRVRAMRVQAGRPWNGPTTSSVPSKK
jgi:hypothetical protein